MKEKEMKIIGSWIAQIIKDVDNESLQEKIKGKVKELCSKFRFY